MENVIEIKHLSKSFGQHEVLKDVNFDVRKGEVVCLIGSSGSGKSTLFRCINLLETPSATPNPTAAPSDRALPRDCRPPPPRAWRRYFQSTAAAPYC